AWNELAEAVTAPGAAAGDVERMLDLARGEHERRREWGAVAKLLEIQISLAEGSAVEAPMQAELARIYHEELCDAEHAREAYRRLLTLMPGNPTATDVLEQDEAKQSKWKDLADRYVHEAESAPEPAFQSALYASAADVVFRYGKRSKTKGLIAEYLTKAI